MRALLAQLCPRPGDLGANIATACDAVHAHPDAQLAVFPELFVSGYRVEDLDAVALEAGDASLKPLAEAAERASTAVIVGFVERAAGRHHNSVACFDSSGELEAVYRKTHLFGAENERFTPGDALCVVELAGRRIAPLICFDAEFPETARQVATAGADLLVTASADMEPEGRDQEIATRARALENRIPHLYVNRCGAERGLEFAGRTRAIDADGVVTAEAGPPDEELILAEVGPPGTTDDRLDYLAQRRGELPVDLGVRSAEAS